MRRTAPLTLLALALVSCEPDLKVSEKPAADAANLDADGYRDRYADVSGLAILLARDEGEPEYVNVFLRGKAANRGPRDVTRMVVDYACRPDTFGITGTRSLGAVAAGETLEIDEKITWTRLSEYQAQSFDCEIRVRRTDLE